MKNSDLFLRIILHLKIQHQVQKQATVLPPGKGQINVLKFLKYKFQPLLQGLVHILFQILSSHMNSPTSAKTSKLWKKQYSLIYHKKNPNSTKWGNFCRSGGETFWVSPKTGHPSFPVTLRSQTVYIVKNRRSRLDSKARISTLLRFSKTSIRNRLRSKTAYWPYNRNLFP